MNEERDIEDQVKITDADGEVSTADRTGPVTTGSESVDATSENVGVLGDVAHPFDQTNGILDDFDETHPGNVTGESPSEFAAAATPEGAEAPSADRSDDTYIDNDTPVIPPPGPPAGR